MLTELGVKNGDLIQAKDFQIKTYESMLRSIETTNLTPVSWLNSELMTHVSSFEVKKKLNRSPLRTAPPTLNDTHIGFIGIVYSYRAGK